MPLKSSSRKTGPRSKSIETSEGSTLITSNELISSPVGFPVRTSARSDVEPELTQARDPDSGASSPDLFAIYDPASRSLRTWARSGVGDWPEFSETLPRSGTMRNGRLYRRLPLVLHISGKDYSFWPTPQASDGLFCERLKMNQTVAQWIAAGMKRPSGSHISSMLTRHPDVALVDCGLLNPEFCEYLMGFPIGWSDSKGWATRYRSRSVSGSES